ncbi:MAG TPA: cyclic nucleotide-binding domain-containing protein, partial [Thermomicrobiales bacterium]
MSELLARTLTRALPLFVRRWREEAGAAGITERFNDEHESPWALLVDAVRSGEYRPLIAAIRHEHVRADDPAAVVTAKLSLLAESARTVYDGDPRDLPMLLRELDAVQDILLQAAAEAPDTAIPAPLVTALDRTAGIVPFVTTAYAPGQMIGTHTNCDPLLAIVRSGRVRLAAPLPDGRMVTLAILREGDLFGTTDARAHRQANAEAMTHSSVSLLHARELPTLIRIAPEAANLT